VCVFVCVQVLCYIYTYLTFGIGYFDLIKDLMISMPKDYKKTISDLQQYLTVDEISSILESPDFMTANQAIIKCLMTRMTHGYQLMSFCNILESIKDAPALAIAINHLKQCRSQCVLYSIVLLVVNNQVSLYNLTLQILQSRCMVKLV